MNLYFPNLAGDSLSTNIPAGSSAKFAANQINENMSDLGIRASAKTRIELYSLSGNGEVSFDIGQEIKSQLLLQQQQQHQI